MKTLVIDNFKGTMTTIREGDINSGQSFLLNTFANDPFVKPGNLTWAKSSEQIDAAGAVITDLITATTSARPTIIHNCPFSIFY